MWFDAQVTTPPTEMPVSRPQVRHFIQSNLTDGEINEEDKLIDNLIKAATSKLQKYACLSFVTQTINMKAYEIDDELELVYGPVQSITSVDSIDSQNNLTPVSGYQAKGNQYKKIAFPSIFTMSSGKVSTMDAQIVYVAGFGDRSAQPESVQMAILKQCQADYEYRKEHDNIPLGVVSNHARAEIDHLSKNVAWVV